jgi:predicted transcriptional regulator
LIFGREYVTFNLYKKELIMDVAIKHHLAEILLKEEDEAILDQIRALLEVDKGDWWKTASTGLKQSVERGLEQLEKGQGIPHEEVIQKIKARFLK